MNNFDKSLNEAIETAVPEETVDVGPFTAAVDLIRQLQDAEESIKNLKTQIRHHTEQLVANLGSEIRKRQPGVEVGLRGGRCSCGYRSRMIECQPDVENGVWSISGSPFARRFTRTYPHLMNLSDNILPLAHALADFFSKQYKRLQV